MHFYDPRNLPPFARVGIYEGRRKIRMSIGHLSPDLSCVHYYPPSPHSQMNSLLLIILLYPQNGRPPAVRESLSMTVEERLKSLLDTPNPGGMSGGSHYVSILDIVFGSHTPPVADSVNV